MMVEENEKLTEEEIIFKVMKYRSAAIEGNASLFDRMRKAEDFKVGYQWDPAVKGANEAKGKFCLTIPLIKPTIKQVCGLQVQNPKDIKVRNLQNGSATVANILSALAKHAMDSEHGQYEKSCWFESGLSTGVGALGFFIDKDTDPRHGNLEIRKLNEFEVAFDPNCRVYDPNTKREGCQFVLWEPWVIKEEVEEQYPDKKQELRSVGSSRADTNIVMGAVSVFIDWLVGTDSEKGSTLSEHPREDITQMEKYRYNVCHTWWREPKRCLMLYDSEKTELDSVLVTKDKDIADVKKAVKNDGSERFSYEEVVRPVMHHTIRVGSILLEDRVDELNGCQMFPIVPFYPYFDNGYKSGMAEDMIGTQEEINWAHSMVCNLLKNLANTGWIGKHFADGKYKTFLKNHGGEDGVILDESKAGGKLEKVTPNAFPVGLAAFTEQAKENIKLTSNVRTEDPTTDKDRVASAIALKQQAAKLGHEAVFRNWDYSLTIAGNLLIEIIRNNEIYSPDEIKAIVDAEELIDAALMDQARGIVVNMLQEAGYQMPEEMTPPDMDMLQQFDQQTQAQALNKMQMEQEKLAQLQRQIDAAARPVAENLVIEEIGNIRRGQYNTKVTLNTMAPTHRLARAAERFELNKALLESNHFPLSRRSLIEATDLPDKEEIIADGERQQAQMAGAA